MLTDCISTDSPGYLLVSDSDSISYYYTLAEIIEIPGTVASVQPLIAASRISGNAHTYVCKEIHHECVMLHI